MISDAQMILLDLVDFKNEQIDLEGPTDKVQGIQLAIDVVTEFMRSRREQSR